MHTTFQALRRPSLNAAFALCALTLFALAAPLCAAPLVSAYIGPATLPVTGGGITITAKVTDPSSQLITAVEADLYQNGSYNGSYVTLSNGGSGNVYTGTLASNGTNTTSASYTYTATVTATNAQNVSSTVTATGKTVQANDETPPTLTSVTIGPSTLPVTGGGITITATVTDPGKRAITDVEADLYQNGSYNGSYVTLSNGGSGSVYTGTLGSSGNNTSSAPYTYTAVVTATNDLNLSNSAATAGKTVQANDATPPTLTAVTIGPATLPVTGGGITITATVTDPGKRAITNVQAALYQNGSYNGSYVTLSNGGSGNVYTGVLASSGNNNSNAPYTYTATVTATDDLNLRNSATDAGKTVQANSGPPASLTPTLYMADATHPTLTPASVAAGSPDLTLTIDGVNITGGATVLFNGVPLNPSSVTATQVTVVVPADLLASPGAYAVSVVNPSPGGISNSVNFNVH